jgi:PAS domain S-box-containing protein
MQEKPKRRRRYAFPYFILGLFIAVIMIGLLSVLYLVYLTQPVTFEGIINLHLTTLLFMYVDIIGLYSALVFGLVGYQKDRAEDARRYSDWLSKNQQQEMLKIHDGQTELDKKHQNEIVQMSERMTNEETKFQELETIIRRGKQQWQSTFDSVDDLIILTDESGAIIRCNRATGEALQLGYSQILGRGIDQLFASEAASLHGMVPGEKKELKAPNQDVWYQYSKNHLLIDGKQEGWVYIFRNITAQKQVLRDQQRLTQYYELMVNNSPVAIATLNHEDRIIDCNPAFEKLFQYSKKEAIGAKVDTLVTPEGQSSKPPAAEWSAGQKAEVTQAGARMGPWWMWSYFSSR